MKKVEIISSEDGSNTIYIPYLNEHYHSYHGAITESEHVFINNGLNLFENEKNIKILEFGFGTGLNALLTLKYADKKKIIYHSIEKYPLKKYITDKLNYGSLVNNILFNKIHDSNWGEDVNITDNFILKKIESDFISANIDDDYNIVYFDAFAPNIQPHLWTKEIFEKIYNSMSYSGVLTTYCAKGSVRRTMQDVGFKVERLPGPPYKREMLRAVKNEITNN